MAKVKQEKEKAIKEMRDKMATGDDDVPGDVLKLLEEYGLTLITKLINTIYVTGEWPRDFIEVTMIAFKKKPKATKCSDHRTYSKDSSVTIWTGNEGRNDFQSCKIYV
jgi:hypothetical protein